MLQKHSMLCEKAAFAFFVVVALTSSGFYPGTDILQRRGRCVWLPSFVPHLSLSTHWLSLRTVGLAQIFIESQKLLPLSVFLGSVVCRGTPSSL